MRMFFGSILVFFLVPLVYAQNNQTESLTINTYYPAPYGVYKNLRLHPSQEPAGSENRGVMYYDMNDKVIKYNNTTHWVNIVGGAGGESSDWAVITRTCPWGSDNSTGAGRGWGNQCGAYPNFNGCCKPEDCPPGWIEVRAGVELSYISCPKHQKDQQGACEWNSTSAYFHPVAVGNVVRTCVKKGTTVITNSTTWWSDHRVTDEDASVMGWGDQCVGPNFDDCLTELDSSTIPRSRVLPVCPVGWNNIATDATVDQVSCYHNQETSGAEGCFWTSKWSPEHPVANGKIVAICEKN